MVYVKLTIPKPSVWSMENVVNTFPRSIEREQIGLRTVIHFILGLTMAWFLNTMGPDSLINIWSSTVLNFSFSLIAISMLRLGTIKYLSSTSTRVLIEQLWRLVVGCRIELRLIWIVSLLVQQKLVGKSLNSIYIESLAVQRLPIHLPNEHYVNFHAHQTVNKVLARQNVEKTQLTAWFDYNCQEHVEQEQSDPEWSRITLEWKGVDNKSGEQPWP